MSMGNSTQLSSEARTDLSFGVDIQEIMFRKVLITVEVNEFEMDINGIRLCGQACAT